MSYATLSSRAHAEAVEGVTRIIVSRVTHVNVSHVTQSSGANFRAAEGVDPPPENAVFREKKTQRN